MIATVPVHAAVHLWTGATSDRFSDASNWLGGSPAGDPAAELVFPPGAVRLAVTNDVPGLTIRTLSVSGPGYTIGGLPLTLTSDAEVTDSSLGPSTIACDLHLEGRATFRNGIGNGHDYYDGGLILAGAISGAGPLVKRAHGRLTFSGTRANTYAGATHVIDGELRLNKSAGVDAIGGDLVIGSERYDANPVVTTLADEQLPDSATIHIGPLGSLDTGGIETVGPLELEGGAEIGVGFLLGSWMPQRGTLILGGDVQILPGFDSVRLDGDLALAGTRTITSCETCPMTELAELRDHTPGSGLMLRGGRFIIRDSRYRGPTLIDGAEAVIFNPETTVRLRGGSFAGEAGALVAEHGTLDATGYGITVHGDLILNASTTVRLNLDRTVNITVQGAVNLGGAALNFDGWRHGRVLGRTHAIVVNEGTDAIRGTFGGAPEGAVLHQQLRVTYAGNDGNDVVFTEVGRYSSFIELRATPDHAASGDTVTLTAIVGANYGSAFGGSVTFREGDAVVGTAAVEKLGTASITLQPTWGRHDYTASYSGTDVYAPSRASIRVMIEAPAPTITSVEPSTFTGGTTVTGTVRGTDFYPGGWLSIASNGVPFTYVSPTELRFTWDVRQYETEVTVPVTYVQPPPGSVSSNPFPIVVKPGAPPQPAFTFEPKAIVAPVVPGGDAAWMGIGVRFVNSTTRLEHLTAITSDTDRDGLARWVHTEDVVGGLWLMADMTDGRIVASTRDRQPPAMPMPPAMFLRDEQGHYAHLMMPQERYPTPILWDVLWVRPGVGAWTATLSDGGERDFDGVQNGYAVHHVSQMRAVGNSPTPPAGFERGDLLAGIDWSMARWFGDRVDSYLDDTDGPGTLQLFHPYNLREGAKASARFGVLRTGGTDGTVTVSYATVNDTAIAGVHYEARAGTLTFGPGELLKTVDVPVINDQVFGGYANLKLVLSQPAGTTITGNTTATVELIDNDPAPVIFASDMSVTEGDHGTREVQFPVHISSDATRVPVGVRWSYRPPPYHEWFTGELTFRPGGPSTQTITIPYEANLTPENNRVILVMIDFSDGVSSSYVDPKITIVDDDLAALTILDATVSESGDEALVTLSMATHSEKTITVRYTTENGSATAGTDFTATPGTATFGPFQSEETISIPIVHDTDAEGDEWFSVVLSDPAGATLRRTSATVILLDDDSGALPSISATSPMAVEGLDDMTFRFRLSFPVAHEVRFRAETVAGSATDDFVPAVRIMTIAPGATEADMYVEVRNDALIEGTETFSLELSKPVGATIATPTALATILDSDFGPEGNVALTVEGVEVVEGGTASFTVRLAQALASAVTVPYATSDSTAVTPGDYVAASGTLTFAPGEMTKTIEIATIDDAQYELRERFRVAVGSVAGTCTIVDNDPVPGPKGRAVGH